MSLTHEKVMKGAAFTRNDLFAELHQWLVAFCVVARAAVAKTTARLETIGLE
ncbi:MAG: hypothetical protein U0175_06175 [Caldilineaceae bacterium]